MLAVHTTGGTLLTLIILFGGCQNETLLTRRRFGTYRHRFLAIVLQLVIAAAVAVHLYVPHFGIQCSIREILVPNKCIFPVLSRFRFVGTLGIRSGTGRSIIGEDNIVNQHNGVFCNLVTVSHKHQVVNLRFAADIEYHILPLIGNDSIHRYHIKVFAIIRHFQVRFVAVIAIHERVHVFITRHGLRQCINSP